MKTDSFCKKTFLTELFYVTFSKGCAHVQENIYKKSCVHVQEISVYHDKELFYKLHDCMHVISFEFLILITHLAFKPAFY